MVGGIRVDEAQDVQAVLRMARELQGDAAADLAGADDHRVLDIGVTPPARSPGERPTQRDQHGRGEPEAHEARHRGVDHTGDLRQDEEQPGADRDQVEHAHHVVDRRVVGPLLVAAVQVVEAGPDDPDRDGREEEQDLVRVRDPVRGSRLAAVQLE